MKQRPETGRKAKRSIENHRRETESNHDFRKSAVPQGEIQHVLVDV